MQRDGVYATRVVGVWTLQLLTNGDLYLMSKYKRKANYGFRLRPVDKKLSSEEFPAYLLAVVDSTWKMLEEMKR